MRSVNDAVEDDVRGFLSSVTGREFTDTEDYFALGYVNSLFALELVTYVEKHFGITVGVADLDMDNFRTIAGIARLVREKLQ